MAFMIKKDKGTDNNRVRALKRYERTTESPTVPIKDFMLLREFQLQPADEPEIRSLWKSLVRDFNPKFTIGLEEEFKQQVKIISDMIKLASPKEQSSVSLELVLEKVVNPSLMLIMLGDRTANRKTAEQILAQACNLEALNDMERQERNLPTTDAEESFFLCRNGDRISLKPGQAEKLHGTFTDLYTRFYDSNFTGSAACNFLQMQYEKCSTNRQDWYIFLQQDVTQAQNKQAVWNEKTGKLTSEAASEAEKMGAMAICDFFCTAKNFRKEDLCTIIRVTGWKYDTNPPLASSIPDALAKLPPTILAERRIHLQEEMEQICQQHEFNTYRHYSESEWYGIDMHQGRWRSVAKRIRSTDVQSALIVPTLSASYTGILSVARDKVKDLADFAVHFLAWCTNHRDVADLRSIRDQLQRKPRINFEESQKWAIEMLPAAICQQCATVFGDSQFNGAFLCDGEDVILESGSIIHGALTTAKNVAESIHKATKDTYLSHCVSPVTRIHPVATTTEYAQASYSNQSGNDHRRESKKRARDKHEKAEDEKDRKKQKEVKEKKKTKKERRDSTGCPPYSWRTDNNFGNVEGVRRVKPDCLKDILSFDNKKQYSEYYQDICQRIDICPDAWKCKKMISFGRCGCYHPVEQFAAYWEKRTMYKKIPNEEKQEFLTEALKELEKYAKKSKKSED